MVMPGKRIQLQSGVSDGSKGDNLRSPSYWTVYPHKLDYLLIIMYLSFLFSSEDQSELQETLVASVEQWVHALGRPSLYYQI